MEEELLSGPVAPQATSEKLLQILSGLAPRDPAASNPATTAAMARSRDAITRTLQRQMERQDEPFSGLNDVATAAITALTSRHKTPFGSALAKLDADRDNSTIRTASALGQQAQRESKTGIDPIKAANLVMRHIEQQARNGDRDAREVDAFVKTLSSNMEPASALRFQTSYGKAIAEYVAQTGRNPEPSEIKTLISDYAARGGFQTKLPNLQIDPFGNPKSVNPYGGGTPMPPPPTGRENPATALGRLPPAGTPQPNEFSGPPLPPNAPGAADRAKYAGTQNNAPQPGMTYAQQGQVNVDRRKADIEFQAFKGLADSLSADIRRAGATAMGPMGWINRFTGAMTEQVRGLLASSEEARAQLPSVIQNVAYNQFLDGVIGTGADAAAIKAGILTFAYRYSKASDPTGPVNKAELEHALNVLGEVWGSPRQVENVMRSLVADAERKRNLVLGTAPAGAAQPAPKKPPVAGDVDVGSDGRAYQFKGGDPANPQSWAPL